MWGSRLASKRLLRKLTLFMKMPNDCINTDRQPLRFASGLAAGYAGRYTKNYLAINSETCN